MNTIHTAKLCLLVAGIIGVHLAPDAHASESSPCGGGFGKLTNGYISLGIRAADFPAGGSFTNALIDSVDAWSSTRSKVDMHMHWAAAGSSPGPENGESEIYWTDNLEVAAVTYTWKGPPSCVIVEADVIFNSSTPYTASTDPDDLNVYGGSMRSFRTAAMHELGHAQGLGHTWDVYSIMGEDTTHIHANDGIATAYPGEDAITNSVALYGEVAGTLEDLGVAHWKRTGSWGEYSLHSRTRVKTSSGSSVVEVEFPDVVYEVGVGDKIKIEMTLENFGKHSQNVRVGYYVSSNDHISTQDRFLGSTMKYVTPNVPTTTTSPELTIPDDLLGEHDYWVGAIIDDQKQVTEVDEWNNRAYIQIRTREVPPDLVASAVFGSGTGKAGNTTLVTSVIENDGGPDVDEFTYEIRLSKNQTITKFDRLVYTSEAASIGTKIDVVTIPGDLSGDYYWGLIVKPVYGEVIESNNRVAGTKMKISVGPPDLQAVSITGPVVGEVGDEITVACDVASIGGPLAGPYTFTVRISHNNEITVTDVLAKSVTTSKLGAKNVTFTIPPLPEVGVYRFGLIVNAVPNETKLADNVKLGSSILITSITGGGDDVLSPN